MKAKEVRKLRKILFGFLCLCAVFAFVGGTKLLSNDDDSLVKTCASPEDDDEEDLIGGPYEGFVLFFKSMNPFIK